MKAFAFFRAGIAALLLALLLPSAAAEAVIPSAFGPIQALLVVLPQLLLALAAALVALLKPRTYKLLFAYLWTHKLLTVLLLAFLAGVGWGAGRIFRTGVQAEQAGGAWAGFRGGPHRTGAVPGATGPRRAPRVLWDVGGRVLADSTTRTSRVDSSPAVVGNRVFFGIAMPSVYGSEGALVALDIDTGGIAWRYTGKGELDPTIRQVFASPAVWTEPPAGPDAVARYLVSGEGYHDDKDCRILVLDLEPVRQSGGKDGPKLHAFVQTTSHVESSPAVHDGRAYIGAGDDGFYCVDLTTGKVAWRIEGDPFYEVAAGPTAEALAPLLGKTVAATGTSKRIFSDAHPDASVQVLAVRSVAEHAGPASPAPGGPSPTERIVIGKVVHAPKDAKRPAGVSPYRLEVSLSIPDCESSPTVSADPTPRLLFGSGLGGKAVYGVNPRTGEVVWKAPVPHPAFGAPTVAGDLVLIGLGNGTFIKADPNPAGAVVAMSLGDGKERWRIATGDAVFGAVAVRGDRAYAGSRDKHLYVIELKQGTLAEKVAVGEPIVSSPAVTDEGIFFTTDLGKLHALDPKTLRTRWTREITPGAQVISSPAIVGDRLLLGSSAGFRAFVPGPGGDGPPPIQPWAGPGGGAHHRGIADDLGVPVVPTNADGECDPRWPTPAALQRPVDGPLIACDGRLFAVFLEGAKHRLAAVQGDAPKILWEIDTPPVLALAADASRLYALAGGTISALDPATGKPIWSKPGAKGAFLALDGETLHASLLPDTLDALEAATGTPRWSVKTGAFAGAPAIAHDVILAIVTTPRPSLVCLSGAGGHTLWSVDLDTAPSSGPTFVEVQGKGRVLFGAGKTAQCRDLADGALVWKAAFDEAVTGHIVAGAYAVVPLEEKLVALKLGDGSEIASLPGCKSPVPPALARMLVVLGGEGRIAAHDLEKSEWPWNYKGQDHIGRAVAPPVIVSRTIWVGTTAHGLLAFGLREGSKP